MIDFIFMERGIHPTCQDRGCMLDHAVAAEKAGSTLGAQAHDEVNCLKDPDPTCDVETSAARRSQVEEIRKQLEAQRKQTERLAYGSVGDGACAQPSSISFYDLGPIEGLIGPLNLSSEAWREYRYENGYVYCIEDPVALYRREGGTTHRVVTRSGVVHCVPCGKDHPNTVIRWKNRNILDPVQW